MSDVRVSVSLTLQRGEATGAARLRGREDARFTLKGREVSYRGN